MQLIPKLGSGTEIDQKIIDDIIRRLKLVENNKDAADSGWDKKNNRWTAHKSKEGGYDTIAWGIKLDPNNADIKPLFDLYTKQKYLTDQQVDEHMPTIAKNYYNRAKQQYESMGYSNWEDLDWKAKSILTDYAYNPGLTQFPNLIKGFAENDYDAIQTNTHRALNGYALTGRNKVIDDEVAAWIKSKREKPQIFNFGQVTTTPDSNTLWYNVKNGKPGKAEMIVEEHWFSPNDTTIRATFPNGKQKDFTADYGLFWDNIDPRFREMVDKFNHDKRIALVKRK